MGSGNPRFLSNVHLFRGAAILLVVATHVLFALRWPPELEWEYKLCLSLVQNGTVPFVFVSGLLFQHRLRHFHYASYLKSKLRYVIAPYVVVSLPFVVLQHHRHFGLFAPDQLPASGAGTWYVASAFLTGAQMPIPLWFVPMISVLYLLAPLLAWLDRHPRSYAALPALLLFASFAHRPEHQIQLEHSVLYFLPVYVAGMWVSRYRERVLDSTYRQRVNLWLLIAATTGLEVLTRARPGAIESAAPFSSERGLFDVNLYQKLAFSLLALEAFRRAGPKITRLLDPVATCSFGIFFLHYYLIYFTREAAHVWGLEGWSGSAAALVLHGVCTTLACTGVSLALRRLLGTHSRYVIGC